MTYHHTKFGETYYYCNESHKWNYIYECGPNRAGTLGQQITDNEGNCLDCDGSYEGLRKAVLRWRKKRPRED